MTLFAPNNEAWNEQYLNSVVKDQVKLKEILDLHLVETKLTVDNIISNNQKEVWFIFFYFRVIRKSEKSLFAASAITVHLPLVHFNFFNSDKWVKNCGRSFKIYFKNYFWFFLQLYIAPTAAGTQFLYFNVAYGPNNLRNLTVEGSGVNATVVQPDIAATNGVIHIINRVLGVPYLNMKEKLLSDPMLK